MKNTKLLIFLLFISLPNILNAQNWIKIYDPVIGSQSGIEKVKVITLNNKRTLFFQTYGLTGAPFIGCNDTNMYRIFKLNTAFNGVYKPLKSFLYPFKCENIILESCSYIPVPEFEISNSDSNFALRYQEASFSNCSGSFHRFQYTTNGGNSFTSVFGDTSRVNSIKISPTNENYIFAAINGRLYKSTNRGQNWNHVTNSPPDIREIVFNPYDPNYVYLSMNNGVTLYISTDAGNTFNTQAKYNCSGTLYFRSIDTIYTYNGPVITRSVNKGLNWGIIYVFPLSGIINSLELNSGMKNVIYTGYANQGVWVSTDNGNTFSSYINNLTPSNHVIGLLKDRPNRDSLYVVTDRGVYIVKDIYTGIKQRSSNVPEKFELEQNFPNPFNPETNIIYKITKAGFSTLIVYDMSGKEITSLVNEHQSPGTYSVLFNADNLSSGVYYYKLSSNNNSQIKKMVLIK